MIGLNTFIVKNMTSVRAICLNENNQLCCPFGKVRRPFGTVEFYPYPFGTSHVTFELRAVLPLWDSIKTYIINARRYICFPSPNPRNFQRSQGRLLPASASLSYISIKIRASITKKLMKLLNFLCYRQHKNFNNFNNFINFFSTLVLVLAEICRKRPCVLLELQALTMQSANVDLTLCLCDLSRSNRGCSDCRVPRCCTTSRTIDHNKMLLARLSSRATIFFMP